MMWTFWILFLPWFLGFLINDEIGIVSVWGIFYAKVLHKSHEVYASGFFDLVSFLVSFRIQIIYQGVNLVSEVIACDFIEKNGISD
jgi:hypothetical protein